MSSAAAGVIIARNEGGSPHLASIRFLVQAGPGAPPIQVIPEVRFCPGRDCDRGIAAIWVTPGPDKLAFQHANPDFWKGDLAKAATAFVQGEIAKGFPDIGPPIDVVRLIDRRIEWVHRQQGCHS